MSVYQALYELETSGGVAALCIIVRAAGSTPRHVGSKMLVYPDGRIVGTIGGGEMESRVIAEARQALQDGRSRNLTYTLADPQEGDPGVCGGTLEVFVEPIVPRPTLVVAGAGHVGQAVAHLAHWLGFRVVVTDDRPEFCTPEVVPEADAYFPGPLESLEEQIVFSDHTYFVLCTRSVDIDVKALPAILVSPAAYVGVIGSRRRWATTRQKLKAVGLTDEQLDRAVSPMGLDIHAETPEEIAVSIMAQIIAVRQAASSAVKP